jgi:hypothetical protein
MMPPSSPPDRTRVILFVLADTLAIAALAAALG